MEITRQTDYAVGPIEPLAQVKTRKKLLQSFTVRLKRGVQLGSKHMILPVIDKFLFPKRAIVETTINQFKHISRIEHSRYPRRIDSILNVRDSDGLIANCHQPKKPILSLATLSALIG